MSFCSSLSKLVLLGAAGAGAAAMMSGCGVAGSFPDVAAVNPDPAQAAIGSLGGSNYGGHAPIIGAHAFLLEANPNATGYGQMVKSLLTSSYANASFPTALDTTSGSPTSGMYYVTTDKNGQFYLTGDYTCDIGSPVYIYASGGNPSAPFPSQNLTVSAATISGSGPYTIVFTDNSLVYQGEQITFSGSGGSLGKYLNGTTQTVNGDSNLTATTFSITVNSLTNNGVTVATGNGNSIGTLTGVQASAPSNAAIVNMAMLGVCGDTSPTNPTVTSTANFSALNFVYMNEVSTVAAAEAMAAFFQTPTYTFTVNVGGLSNNGVTENPGAVSNLGSLSAHDNNSGADYTITGASISGAGPATITMSATGPVANGDSVFFSNTGAAGTFAAYISGSTQTVTSASTTSDALHLSVPAGHAQAMLGLQGAARNAALLYDIQGLNNIGNNNGNGDARVARTVTPANANGVVPQALLNTLGNILANCVDSANLYGVTNTSGFQSGQCRTLFANATADGTTTGLKPNDIATAAINIAHHPAGEPSGNSTFVTNLFNLPTGNVPFFPNLSLPPNDFSVGIAYSGGGLNTPVTGVAIDASNNAWFTVGAGIAELGPQGAVLSGPTGYANGINTLADISPVIDTIGNLWFVNNRQAVVKMNSSGVIQSPVGGYDFQGFFPTAIAIDANNNAWVTNSSAVYYPPTNSIISVTEITQGGVQTNISTNPTNSTNNATPNNLTTPWGIALDGSGLIWVSGYSTNNLATINTSTNAVNWYSSSSSASTNPKNLAFDQNGVVWLPNSGSNTINTIVPAQAVSSGTPNVYNVPFGSYSGGGYVGGGYNGSNQITVDGANNIWAMSTNNYVSEFSNTGVPLTPATGYAGGMPTGAAQVGFGFTSAVDLSGNLWVTTNVGTATQMIGIATPVVTPLVAATKTGTPAARP